MSEVAPELAVSALLASVRLSALFSVAPIFGHMAIPLRVRAALALAITAALAPALPAPGIALPAELPRLAIAAVGEVATGAALGFSTRLVFDAIGFFGGLYSAQAGLGAATAIDPASGAPSTAPSALFEGVAALVYLAIDGHHALLRAAATSFEVLAPGGGGPALDSMLGVARLGAHVFEVGLQLAAPVTVAMLVANVALGVLGRALPEMNLMMVQIPAHVLFGFGLLLAGVSPLGRAIAAELAAHSERAVATVLFGSP